MSAEAMDVTSWVADQAQLSLTRWVVTGAVWDLGQVVERGHLHINQGTRPGARHASPLPDSPLQLSVACPLGGTSVPAMQAITAAEPVSQRSDDVDLRPIPLKFLRPAAPPAWEPVGAVARALGRLQHRPHNVHQEVRRDAHTQRVAERLL